MQNTLPVLVYGTLRPGCSNYPSFLEGRTVDEQNVRIDGFTMHSRGGFPYLVRGEGTVTATLVSIPQGRYTEVMRGLDMLEGFHGDNDPHNHYDRVVHTVTLPDGTEVDAFIYVAAPRVADEVRKNLPVIESGDWVQFVTEDNRGWGYTR